MPHAASAAARFVTLCARERDVAPAALLADAAGAVDEWGLVVGLAVAHGAAGLVHQAIGQAGLAVPEKVYATLRAHALQTLARVLQLETELQRVAAGLAEAGLSVLVLKGPVLSRTIYASPALRPYNDLDLTIREGDEAAAVSALEKLGFVEGPSYSQAWWRAHAHAHAADHAHEPAPFHRKFVGPASVLVELHMDPLQLGLHPTCEAGRWRRAVPIPHLPAALMLAPEDQLVQLSVHVHKHGFSRLIWLKDLDLLLRAAGGSLDWDLVESVARAEGVRASVWHAVRLSGELLSAPVPAGALDRFRPAIVARALHGLVWPTAHIAALQGSMRRRAVQFDASESWRGMLPGLVLMGRRRARARALLRAVLGR